MSQRSAASIGASLLVATLALTACGSRGGDTTSSTSGSTGSGSAAAGTKTAKIGVIAPLSGDLAALGLGIQNSVDLAIKQANDSNAIPGWKLELAAQDDQATADVGKNAATKLAGDKDVIGVVGTLNSSVSLQVQPVLASANIVQVSPANTGVSLTAGEDAANPKRPFATYFRTCTTDAVQGPFAARYLFETAGIKEVATVHDKKAYGQGLVAAFTAEFEKLGGKIVAAETINPDEDKYDAVVSAIKPKAPKAVYYGGEYPQGAPLSQQMKAAGLNIPLMGGDGLYDGKFIELAGSESAGDLATSVGAPTDSTDAGKTFLKQYEEAGYDDPSAAYGGYSYDAANAIINALKVSLKDASSVEEARKATVDALGKVSFDGVTGKVAFDELGDTTTKVLTVYKVTDGAWKPENTAEFK